MSQPSPPFSTSSFEYDRNGEGAERSRSTSPALLPHIVEDESDDEELHKDLEQLDLLRDEPVLKGTPRILGCSKTWKMIGLTVCLAGLQFTWTVEMAYGTPYLLSLGLSKASMSLVWIAGPLSGLVMQPIVGAFSDKCTSSFGRRRPFIVGGSIIMVLILFIIGWTREFAAALAGAAEGESFTRVAIRIAIFSIYILDFAVNTVQAAIRALIVDSLPPSQQEDGTAWAGRMVGLGSVVGYFMGYIDLVAIFGFLGNTQLKVLCVIASLVLIACDGATCYVVTERILVQDGSHGTSKKSWESPFKTLTVIFSHIRHLPPPIQRLCNIQFFAWIGWFPFLFYSTTWVAEIYTRTSLKLAGETPADAVGQATRAGSYAFLVYSLFSLSASFLLPLVIAPSSTAFTPQPQHTITLFDRKFHVPSFTLPWLTLPRAWAISHGLFCLAMLSTFFAASSVPLASAIIALCGVSWAITMWAPFSLLGEFISRAEAAPSASREGLGTLAQGQVSRINLAAASQGIGHDGGMYTLVETVVEGEYEMGVAGGTGVMIREVDDEMMETREHRRQERGRAVPELDVEAGEDDDEDRAARRHMIDKRGTAPDLPDNDNVLELSLSPTSASTTSPADSAGILLGIHNMYIVLPQFLVTFLSSLVFRVLEPEPASAPAGAESGGEVEAGADAIGVVLRFGGVMAGVAGVLAWQLSRQV